MATLISGKENCVKCEKERATSRCTGCLQYFCYSHFKDHHQELNKQLDEIEVSRDIFKQILDLQINRTNHGLILKQIDEWEENSIKIIQQTANECREIVFQYANRDIHQIEVNLIKLTDQLTEMRREDDFNEIDIKELVESLSHLKDQLKETKEEPNPPSNLSIQQTFTPLVNKISVIIPSPQPPSSLNMKTRTKWKQYGITVAGGNGKGNRFNQFSSPRGIYIDDDEQSIYIADYENHRVIEWRPDAMNGLIVAGGNGQGYSLDQLDRPTDSILDKKNNALIICDRGNRRVIQWSAQNEKKQEILISNIYCSRVAMDSEGCLYVSDWDKNEVVRCKPGEPHRLIVAGGHGKGEHRNQLNSPTYLFVDQDRTVYVSDYHNNRVMKWKEGARKGTIVAGGQGQGHSRSQLDHPQGIVVDQLGNVYVADCWNHRVMCWRPGEKRGSVVVGGNGRGDASDQFQYPVGLSFDRKGNLYVVDQSNHRVQKFNIDNDD
ncbi:unnamed protein product [Adineta steineri]|uniref:Uncharacterized protein n=1 Tax=Adineta steineri TaxID=433720 RepID=A0A815LBD4_9BILA|nr:unnamed protein product [Adineta steineri]CAF3891356.1 unnamed protein product [Adineta steineri]